MQRENESVILQICATEILLGGGDLLSVLEISPLESTPLLRIPDCHLGRSPAGIWENQKAGEPYHGTGGRYHRRDDSTPRVPAF